MRVLYLAFFACILPSLLLAKPMPISRNSHWIVRNRVPGECKGWGATTFVYARHGELRMRLRICDRIGNLRLIAVEINGIRVGNVDAKGLRVKGRPVGFDGSWTPWIDFRRGVRSGLNKISLFPVGRKLAPEARGQQTEWNGEIRFGRCRRVDVYAGMKGWGDVALIGEQVYEVLAELDEACRRPECYRKRRRYLNDRKWIHRRVRRLLGKRSTSHFWGILNHFYHETHRSKINGSVFLQRWMDLYDQVRLRQKTVWETPFALFLYSRNRSQRYLTEFLRELSLARAQSRRAFEALFTLPPNYSGDIIRQAEKALDTEKGRLHFLIKGIESVRMACVDQFDTMAMNFPFWKRDFKRSFAAYLRQKKIPRPDYPTHGDLRKEMTILNDYFDMMVAFARHDLEFLNYLQTGVRAMLSRSTRPLTSGSDPSRYLRRQPSVDPPGSLDARKPPLAPRSRSYFSPARRSRH